MGPIVDCLGRKIDPSAVLLRERDEDGRSLIDVDEELEGTDPARSKSALDPGCCPYPGGWKLVKGPIKRNGRLRQVSPFYGPSDVPLTVTLRTDREFTAHAVVKAEGQVNLGVISQQIGVELGTSAGIKIGETLEVTIGKGVRVYFGAYPVYLFRGVERKNYDARCKPYIQRAGVFSPVQMGKTVVKG